MDFFRSSVILIPPSTNREREPVKREVKLLKLIKGHTVLLNPHVSAASGDSGDSVDKLFDEGDDAEQEHSVERDDNVLEETIAKDVSKVLVSRAGLQNLKIMDSQTPCLDSTYGPVLHLRDKVRSRNLENFGDSAFAGEDNINTASSSKLNEPMTLLDSFYAYQDFHFETLQNIYVPTWKVTNDSVLHDPYIYRDLTDRLAPPTLFSQLLSMQAKHTLEQKDHLEDKCVEQTNLLSEIDAEIAHLRSLLSLKEIEAAEAIYLRSQLFIVEAADAAKSTELRDLKERNFALEGEKDVLSEMVITLKSTTASKETELASLTAQSSSLESAFELFKERMKAMQDEQSAVLGNKSSKYLQALGKAIDCAVNKEAKYIDAVNALGTVDFFLLSELRANKDASMVNLMDSLHLEGPLAEILKVEDLEASTFATPVTTKPITTLSITFTSSDVVPPLFISNYQALDIKPNDTDPHVVTFDKEELATSPE
nr:hypothetical protein [Tanacetum cinerariifolium]